MYSKKNIIKRKKPENNYIEKNKKISPNPIHKIYRKNYLTVRGEENNSFNYDYLKNNSKNFKRIKNINNMNKFYIKKMNIINDKVPQKNIKNYQNKYLESITQERVKKKKNIINPMQKPNINFKSNINEFDYSTNLSKENIVESLNNYNYNISGYNTINNVGIEIKLDNNTCSSISSNKLQKSINYGINKYNYITKPDINYFNIQNRTNSNREKLRKHYLHKSTPDLNKFLSLINDNPKDNTYLTEYSDKNKLTLNTKNNSNILYLDNHFRSISKDKNDIKKKRTRSFKYDPLKIKKELEYRKNEFEKMRSIEKKIKKYFAENGVSSKNRELYHQSGIIIQSNFRAYMIRKKVKLFWKYKGILNLLHKIFYMKKSKYFDYFIDNVKMNENFEKNHLKTHCKYKITKKIHNLKVEILNNFSIINNNKMKLNEKLEKENNNLKRKLNEFENLVKKLKKENEIYKNKYNNNLSDNKKDIHKIKENIENVSKELEEISNGKKKNENISLPYNLKSYISINNKNFRRPNTIIRNFDLNDNKDNKDKKEYKLLYLKYLINLKIIKIREDKKYNFFKFKTKIKLNELNQIIHINKIRQMIYIIKYKLKQNVYFLFLMMYNKYLVSKNQKPVKFKNIKLMNTIINGYNKDNK